MPQKILIVDDDHAVCTSLQLLLKKKGYQTKAVNHPAVVEETINEFQPSLILLDMNFTISTTGKQGIKLLEQIIANHPQLPVILMTGWATVQLAVKGMKLGAKDFIAKPWENDQLLSSITSILFLTNTSPSSESKLVKGRNEDMEDRIVGDSEGITKVKKIARRVAQTDATVLITGDSGTGKELIAEYIHLTSQRSQENFVKVNLGGISNSLFESEMFGHKKGAFTDAQADRIGRFEKANNGTIFLDEIGELPLENQVKLLRVLQEKSYEILGSSDTKKSNVRVISATNKNLLALVAKGLFREDLYYRINLIHIHIPKLSERKEDIPLLMDHFTQNISRLYELKKPRIDREAYDWMSSQQLPGNIRQLKNIVERAILLNPDKKLLSWKDFQSYISDKNSEQPNLPKVGTMSLEEMEIRMIKKTLAFHNQSISAASRDLGITRSALYRRLEKFNIPHES